jgi:hypothetical protein
MSPSEQVQSESEENTDLRGFRRVTVRLRVAVVLDRETACLAHTLNVCEGGMLLSDYHGPNLSCGRLVGVSLRGVLSDSEDPDAEHYLMRVVRHFGDSVALRFAADS